MRDHSLLVRKSLVDALLASASIRSLVNEEVYGEMNPSSIWPSIKIGLPRVLPFQASCQNGGEIFIAVHSFARGPSSDQASEIGSTAIKVLDQKPLYLGEGVDNLILRCVGAQMLNDFASPTDYHHVAEFNATTAEEA